MPSCPKGENPFRVVKRQFGMENKSASEGWQRPPVTWSRCRTCGWREDSWWPWAQQSFRKPHETSKTRRKPIEPPARRRNRAVAASRLVEHACVLTLFGPSLARVAAKCTLQKVELPVAVRTKDDVSSVQYVRMCIGSQVHSNEW